ncbi:S-layer homology domain-containing protein [Paenibacillus qinlingensis]|uniref:S-layer homology domain-containing protein n=1 Tax=Paenibacillus qinlingensis TaxID=1837343 RepID=UPI001562FBEE|nr:S-layer homology domain-containing protein [Paenibacillus qinlingensis]NQX62687.1 S-layer homology domain-containing protein [Paenibacillus qinlingensis]
MKFSKLLHVLLLSSLVISLSSPIERADAAVVATSFDIHLDRTIIVSGDEVVVTMTGAGEQLFKGYEAEVAFDATKLSFIHGDANSQQFTYQAEYLEGNHAKVAVTRSSPSVVSADSTPILTFKFKSIATGSADVTLVGVKALKPPILAATKFTPNVTKAVTVGATTSSPPGGGGGGNHPPTTAPRAGTVEVQPIKHGESAQAGLDASTYTAALGQAPMDQKGNKVVTVVLKPEAGVKEYVVSLPKEAFNATKHKAQESDKKVEIQSPLGTLTIPDNMFKLKDIGTNPSSIEFSIAKADTSSFSPKLKEKTKDKPIIELTVKINGEVVTWKNKDAPVTVRVAYTPTAKELQDPEHIVIWYVDGDGKVIKVPSGKYDAATGEVTFATTHFSMYAVTYEETTYDDIQSVHWAKKQIEVLASKGVINGTTESTFTPSANITRADFLKLLVETLGLSAEVEGNFDDVQPSDYYYEEARLARQLGISAGVGNNKLNPQDFISRQDMMVMVERAIRIAGNNRTVTSAVDMNKFTDFMNIASYAKDSIRTLIQQGLVEGDGQNLHPTGNTTRAEAAVLLYKLYYLQ